MLTTTCLISFIMLAFARVLTPKITGIFPLLFFVLLVILLILTGLSKGLLPLLLLLAGTFILLHYLKYAHQKSWKIVILLFYSLLISYLVL